MSRSVSLSRHSLESNNSRNFLASKPQFIAACNEHRDAIIMYRRQALQFMEKIENGEHYTSEEEKEYSDVSAEFNECIYAMFATLPLIPQEYMGDMDHIVYSYLRG